MVWTPDFLTNPTAVVWGGRGFAASFLGNTIWPGDYGHTSPPSDMGQHTTLPTVRFYDKDGVLQWSSTEIDYCNQLAVDQEGNVFAAGQHIIDFTTNTQSMRLIKLSSSGAVLWRVDLDTPSIGTGSPFPSAPPQGVATDRDGNCWISFYGGSIFGEPVSALSKYDPDGLRLVGPLSSGFFTPFNLFCDGDGSVFLSNDFDLVMTIKKFKPNGSVEWTINGAGHVAAVDLSNNVFGYNRETGFLTKFDTDGVIIWQKSIGSGRLVLIVCDGSNIYVGDDSNRVSKYDRDGVRAWSTTVTVSDSSFGISAMASIGGGVFVAVDGVFDVDSDFMTGAFFPDFNYKLRASDGEVVWQFSNPTPPIDTFPPLENPPFDSLTYAVYPDARRSQALAAANRPSFAPRRE
jgi:hypothetical protein